MADQSSDIAARLASLMDVRVGLPITSHRGRVVGQGIVLTKKVFRAVAKPFLNEALRKQVVFNEVLVTWVDLTQRRLRLLDDAMNIMRHGADSRFRQFDERLRRLEQHKTDSASESRAS